MAEVSYPRAGRGRAGVSSLRNYSAITVAKTIAVGYCRGPARPRYAHPKGQMVRPHKRPHGPPEKSHLGQSCSGSGVHHDLA